MAAHQEETNWDSRHSQWAAPSVPLTSFRSIRTREQDLVQALAPGRRGGDVDADVPLRFEAGQSDHALGKLHDAHRLVHVEDVDGNTRALHVDRPARRRDARDAIKGNGPNYWSPPQRNIQTRK
jgi:hypothetical protein